MCRPLGLTHWVGMLGHHTGPAPVPGTNSKTTCFLLLTPGTEPTPPTPLNPGGSGCSARGMNASGSTGSTLGIGKGQEEEGWGGSTYRVAPLRQSSDPPHLGPLTIWGSGNGRASL